MRNVLGYSPLEIQRRTKRFPMVALGCCTLSVIAALFYTWMAYAGRADPSWDQRDHGWIWESLSPKFRIPFILAVCPLMSLIAVVCSMFNRRREYYWGSRFFLLCVSLFGVVFALFSPAIHDFVFGDWGK